MSIVICNDCKRHATKHCGRCGKVGYCCKEHQVRDWPKHRKECNLIALCHMLDTYNPPQKDKLLYMSAGPLHHSIDFNARQMFYLGSSLAAPHADYDGDVMHIDVGSARKRRKYKWPAAK